MTTYAVVQSAEGFVHVAVERTASGKRYACAGEHQYHARAEGAARCGWVADDPEQRTTEQIMDATIVLEGE